MLDNGKPLKVARAADVPLAVDLFRYYGWMGDQNRRQHHSDFGSVHAGQRNSWPTRCESPLEWSVRSSRGIFRC